MSICPTEPVDEIIYNTNNSIIKPIVDIDKDKDYPHIWHIRYVPFNLVKLCSIVMNNTGKYLK